MEFVKKYLGKIIGVIVALFVLVPLITGLNSEGTEQDYKLMTGAHVLLTKTILWISGIMVVGFSGYKFIMNPKALIKFGVPAIGLLVLLFISYIKASPSEALKLSSEKAFELQLAGTVYYATITLLIMAFGIYGLLRGYNLFKK